MIEILDENFGKLNAYIEQVVPSKLIVIVDENTHEKCLPKLLEELSTHIPIEIIELEAGEEIKNIASASAIWQTLADYNADRNALVINLGGGVITDIGGFAASTYKRGINFINIPTSLLAMVDASIGGKTGIDLGFLKNIVGTFKNPERIFIYENFLNTLPYRELRSGFAEMLKHGLIADKKHWENLISIPELSAEKIFPYIKDSMRIKNQIVKEDFYEQNIRKTLNFGHTIGHAVESLFLMKENPIAHGEAVAIGMICETHLSYLENLINLETHNNIIESIRFFFPYINIGSFTNEEISNIMLNDKKNNNHEINFSLLKSIGTGTFNTVISKKKTSESLDFYKNIKD